MKRRNIIKLAGYGSVGLIGAFLPLVLPVEIAASLSAFIGLIVGSATMIYTAGMS